MVVNSYMMEFIYINFHMASNLKRTIYGNQSRYHSEEKIKTVIPKIANRQANSNHSHYLNKTREKTRLLSVENEECAISIGVKTKKFQEGSLNLPKIPTCQEFDLNQTIGRKTIYNRTNALIYLKKNINKNYKIQAKLEQKMIQFASLTHQGSRIKNEDRVVINQMTVKDKQYHYFAVFDGHGGHMAANYLSKNLHLFIKQNLEELEPLEAIKASIQKIEDQFKKNQRLSHKSGSCALVCLINNQKCWVANVGDSRMLSISNTNIVSQITNDHKPQAQVEQRRILNNGGDVYRNIPQDITQYRQRKIPYRVYPGKLSVSRTIGDNLIKRLKPNCIIAEPEMFSFDITELSHLLLFSDGVYEKLSNKQISNFFIDNSLQKSLNKLFLSAKQLNSEDNRSLIAIRLAKLL